jgi:hypothetical protein
VNVADRRRGEGLAAVRAATLVALVLPLGAVVDQAPLAGAVFSAAPELGVEGVQDLGVEAADLHLAEQRPDVVLHVRLIELQRVRRALELVQVALQQLIERRACLRVPALRDLHEQTIAGTLRIALRARALRDHLGQDVPLLRLRVSPAVHTHPQSTTRKGLDVPASPPCSGARTTCHGTETRATGATCGATMSVPMIMVPTFVLVKRGAGDGNRTRVASLED